LLGQTCQALKWPQFNTWMDPRLRWREETALNQKNNICDRNGDVRDFEKGNVDGVSDFFDKERWSWRTHRSRTPGLEWWRTLHKALPAEEWVLLGSPSSFLRILLYTLISSDEMTECFWLKSEGEISKWTHHMRAGEDIQVGDRDPESKKRLMYRLGWLITRVQVYQYISPTSLHPLLKSNEQKTHIQTSAQRQENENVYRGRKA